MTKMKIMTIARVESKEEKTNKDGKVYYAYRLTDMANRTVYALGYDVYEEKEFVLVSINAEAVAGDIRYSAFIEKSNALAEVFAVKYAENVF